jgi:hypothetical protein
VEALVVASQPTLRHQQPQMLAFVGQQLRAALQHRGRLDREHQHSPQRRRQPVFCGAARSAVAS